MVQNSQPSDSDLNAVTVGLVVSDEADSNYVAETEDLDKQRKAAELEDFRQEIDLRKDYCRKIFTLVSVWLAFVGLVIFLAGLGWVGPYPFNLATSVLIALVTTTTGSVIGIFLIVARHLFPRR